MELLGSRLTVEYAKPVHEHLAAQQCCRLVAVQSLVMLFSDLSSMFQSLSFLTLVSSFCESALDATAVILTQNLGTLCSWGNCYC